MKKKFFNLLIFAFLFFSTNVYLYPKVIIWDLGGVLFRVDKLRMAYNEIGLKNILWYSIRDLKNPKKIQQRVFEILYKLGKQPTNSNHEIACAPSGLELPQIMCDLLEGKTTPEDILTSVYAIIDELEEQNFFVSLREKNILKKTIKVMFDPKILARYIRPVIKACPLLEEIMQHSECDQYILSNWDSYSFEYLFESKHGKKIFSYFDPEHIVISGQCGIIKPKKEIFEYFLTTYNIDDPDDCIFIDDLEKNIKAAKECGLQAIWFHGMSFKELRFELYKCGFLSIPSTSNPASANF